MEFPPLLKILPTLGVSASVRARGREPKRNSLQRKKSGEREAFTGAIGPIREGVLHASE
jgi:hypothetical protein